MSEDEGLKEPFAMPITSPAYPRGSYRFVNREFLISTYRTDPGALAAVIPVDGTWEGPSALELRRHALAPVAPLPVREINSGIHIVSDLSLGLGTVAHNYLDGQRNSL